MKLLPALKQKKRYIVFEVISDQVFLKQDLKMAAQEALKDFLGELGVAKAAPLFVKAKNNRFIIKVNHKYVDESKAALALIKTIKKKAVIVKSIITSGTVKKASAHLES